jgi:hypothetical protein
MAAGIRHPSVFHWISSYRSSRFMLLILAGGRMKKGPIGLAGDQLGPFNREKVASPVAGIRRCRERRSRLRFTVRHGRCSGRLARSFAGTQGQLGRNRNDPEVKHEPCQEPADALDESPAKHPNQLADNDLLSSSRARRTAAASGHAFVRLTNQESKLKVIAAKIRWTCSNSRSSAWQNTR